MNKADLINEITKTTGIKDKRDVQAIVEGVFSTISNTLKSGESITIVGFGTFKAAKRKARIGRNPQTGEQINIPERSVAKFIPGKNLKGLVNPVPASEPEPEPVKKIKAPKRAK